MANSKYAKKYYKKDADELHDRYIKKLLRSYGWKTEEITPELILYKRNALLIKRKKKLKPISVNFHKSRNYILL